MAAHKSLSSLAANYTDSEGEAEEEFKDIDDELGTENNSKRESEKHASPPRSRLSKESNPKVVSRLVSYGHDELVASDEENDISEEPSKISIEDITINDGDDDIQLPPKPPGRCSKELQDKFIKMLDLKKTRKIDINTMIQSRKDFRNPSIGEKLIHLLNINENGTNYPPSLYDPGRWGKESYYDELLKAQMAEVERRAKKKTKVEFVSGTAKRPASSALPNEDVKIKK